MLGCKSAGRPTLSVRKRDVNADSVTLWWEVGVTCKSLCHNMNDRCVILSIQNPDTSWHNFHLCNIVTHFKISYLLIPLHHLCHVGLWSWSLQTQALVLSAASAIKN